MGLSKEEKDLIKSIEKDEWESVSNLQKEIARSKKIAEATLKKSKRMNIRMTEKDMEAIKIKAMEESIPYQTLVSSIIHKYVSGRLIEKPRKIKDK